VILGCGGWLARAHAGRLKPPRVLPLPVNLAAFISGRPALASLPSPLLLHPSREIPAVLLRCGVRRGDVLPRRASSLFPRSGSASKVPHLLHCWDSERRSSSSFRSAPLVRLVFSWPDLLPLRLDLLLLRRLVFFLSVVPVLFSNDDPEVKSIPNPLIS
jgi:hypothetical protein